MARPPRCRTPGSCRCGWSRRVPFPASGPSPPRCTSAPPTPRVAARAPRLTTLRKCLAGRGLQPRPADGPPGAVALSVVAPGGRGCAASPLPHRCGRWRGARGGTRDRGAQRGRGGAPGDVIVGVPGRSASDKRQATRGWLHQAAEHRGGGSERSAPRRGCRGHRPDPPRPRPPRGRDRTRACTATSSSRSVTRRPGSGTSSTRSARTRGGRARRSTSCSPGGRGGSATPPYGSGCPRCWPGPQPCPSSTRSGPGPSEGGPGSAGAAFVALSPFAIFYSTEARPYATMAFLVALSSLALISALEDGASRGGSCTRLGLRSALRPLHGGVRRRRSGRVGVLGPPRAAQAARLRPPGDPGRLSPMAAVAGGPEPQGGLHRDPRVGRAPVAASSSTSSCGSSRGIPSESSTPFPGRRPRPACARRGHRRSWAWPSAWSGKRALRSSSGDRRSGSS